MGIMDTMKDAMDVLRKIELRSALELDELYAILSRDEGVRALGEPALKKGLLGKSVQLPKVSRVTPKITVKGNVVKLRKVEDSSSTSVSIGGGPSFVVDKDLRGVNGIRTMSSGSEYFKAVCDAVEAALQGR